MIANEQSYEFVLETNPLPVYLNKCRLGMRFTDITLKVVLGALSLVMKAWLTENWQEKNNVFKLCEQFVDPDIVEDLLPFMYTAKVTITTNNAHASCIASHYLSISSLLDKTEQFLSERVSATNFYDLFQLADKLEIGTLRKSCSKYVAENCKTALKNDRINTHLSFLTEYLIKMIRIDQSIIQYYKIMNHQPVLSNFRQ